MKSMLGTIILLTGLNAFAHHEVGEEVLLGAQIFGRTIKLQVRTGGCTWKESFIVKKTFNRALESTELTFIRVTPDNCEAYIPEGRVITFTLGDLRLRSGQTFVIKNTFAN